MQLSKGTPSDSHLYISILLRHVSKINSKRSVFCYAFGNYSYENELTMILLNLDFS